MTRRPLRQQHPPGREAVSTATIPAPVGGWNAHDPLAAMPAIDAPLLDNWFPGTSEVSLRKGSATWVSGFSENLLSFLPYNSPSSKRLFASTPSGIYDVTSSGAAGAIVKACTNGDWQSVNFTTPGGSFLVAVNGVDEMVQYDGTTWQSINDTSTPAITGLLTSQLTSVTPLVNRLWFTKRDSLSAYYLGLSSIGGALVEFPLGQVFTHGGYLVAMTNWTIDGGQGVDDYSIFMTSEGEVAVYRGTDPSSASTWAKVGTYYIAPPVGKRPFCRYGGDVLILTKLGLYPLSRALLSSSISRNIAVSSKIDVAFNFATYNYGTNPGWQAILYPEAGFLLVNVPVTTSYSEQYVFNTISRAWCRFKGWSSYAWVNFDGQLYYTTDGQVRQAWVGTSDSGIPIVGEVQQAYNYLGVRGRRKTCSLAKPTITGDGVFDIELSLNTDFSEVDYPSSETLDFSTGDLWDATSSLWDSAVWASSAKTNQTWGSTANWSFYAAALHLRVTSSLATISWSVTDYVFKTGGIL